MRNLRTILGQEVLLAYFFISMQPSKGAAIIESQQQYVDHMSELMGKRCKYRIISTLMELQ